MDTMAIASMATDMKMAQVQQQVSTTMVKKVMDVQTQAAATLLDGFAASAPSPVASSAPVSSSLGNLMDTYA